MTYTPEPIDTAGIELPEEVDELVELLARHVHDTWARGRMAEGWHYGPQMDLEKRVRPDLVPYNDLPETEKDYDRRTAIETLKMIISLGYTIEKKKS
ncbi:Ryanodine receptor Ryr [Methanofollis formosanus]|uniref:Ryanodine receptor Ryr n=1 Tax=Methanofollis formosanus TaxID=299308 RepID=A0A8G1EEH7_9EURY|nr:RyR domain-containing protein [Methanofollis formosanus]QYZ78075.1 Ryanodine receptor Ryr [Methanofollis formosanus]